MTVARFQEGPLCCQIASRYHDVFPVQVNAGVLLTPAAALPGDTRLLAGVRPVVINHDTLLLTQVVPSLQAHYIQQYT